jgi:polyribonucleotide nucleotidyltransferase
MVQILLEALSHATKARHTILDTLVLALEGPRVDVRDNAPRFGSVTVEKELLGRVIGPQVGPFTQCVIKWTQRVIYWTQCVLYWTQCVV